MMFVHTCHILPPSEIDLGLFLRFLQAQEGNIYFTELAESVGYGNYVIGYDVRNNPPAHVLLTRACPPRRRGRIRVSKASPER